jgi:hypothetical protein
MPAVCICDRAGIHAVQHPGCSQQCGQPPDTYAPYLCHVLCKQYAKHTLLRSSVEELLCLTCGHTQPLAAGAYCQACSSCFREYACTQCAFFDSDLDAGYWHCSECGICRRGGRSNFFHCSGCGCCLRTHLQVGFRFRWVFCNEVLYRSPVSKTVLVPPGTASVRKVRTKGQCLWPPAASCFQVA